MNVDKLSVRFLLAVIFLCTWICVAITEDQACMSPLGMESGDISRDRITASSRDCTNDCELRSFGRLHSNDSWYPEKLETPERDQWIQVDLLETKNVTGIQTQGHNRLNTTYFVSSFKIQSSEKAAPEWTTYKNSSDPKVDAIFEGNMDEDTVRENLLDRPILARYIRVIPWTWSPNGVSLRLELLGCAQGRSFDTSGNQTTSVAIATLGTQPVAITTEGTAHTQSTHRSTVIPVSSNTTDQNTQQTTGLTTTQTVGSGLKRSSFPIGAIIGGTIGGVLGLILLLVVSVAIAKRRLATQDKFTPITNPIYEKTTRPLDSNRNQPRSAPGSSEEMQEFVPNSAYRGLRTTGASEPLSEPLKTNTADEAENV